MLFLPRFKRTILPSLVVAGLCTVSTAQAWDNEVSVGYGWGKEMSEDYHNQAVVVSGKLYKFNKIDDTLIATIDGTLAHIHADTANNNNVSLAAASLAFRAYFQNPDLHKTRPYLGVSFGPAYLSNQQLGNRQLGANAALQSMFEAGIEFGLPKGRSIDVGMHLYHYCNGGIFTPNQSINIPYVLSVGYQF
jgi:hypothetical protein